ncbi:hypothetical protein HDU96_008392 [Phlyctochytrium bullatum]|nr:hypothetical protein HDU96_008392 [Phlyctochytrium bullatum]
MRVKKSDPVNVRCLARLGVSALADASVGCKDGVAGSFSDCSDCMQFDNVMKRAMDLADDGDATAPAAGKAKSQSEEKPPRHPSKRPKPSFNDSDDDSADEGGFGEGELEIDLSVAEGATPSDLLRMALWERDKEPEGNPDGGDPGAGSGDGPVEVSDRDKDEKRRVVTRLFEMALEAFEKEEGSFLPADDKASVGAGAGKPTGVISVPHAACLRELGAHLGHAAFVEAAATALKGRIAGATGEPEDEALAWVGLGRCHMELLTLLQGFGPSQPYRWAWEEAEGGDEEEAEEEEAEDEGGEGEGEEENMTEEEVEKIRKEAEVFEGMRSALAKAFPLMVKRDAKTGGGNQHLKHLSAVGKDLMRYALAQRKKDRKSPIPTTVLRWTLALIESTISPLFPENPRSHRMATDEDDANPAEDADVSMGEDEPASDPADEGNGDEAEDDDAEEEAAVHKTLSETEAGCDVLFTKACVLYQLARCEARDYGDAEGAAADLWRSLKTLAHIEIDVDRIVKASELAGQCYIFLASTEPDEEAASDVLEQGLKTLSSLSEQFPEIPKLKRVVDLLRSADA